jgi:hypothetical protein
MKYNAIVDSGIPILKRYDIPDHLIPPVRHPSVSAMCENPRLTRRIHKSKSTPRLPPGISVVRKM